MQHSLYCRFGKRWLDLTLAGFTLLLMSPGLLLVAVLIRLDSKGPVFFLQERLGQTGSIFRAFKFRTMTDRPRVCDQEIIGKTDEVTGLGYWLRRFKIDELPQLWNVVRGEMSLVGPRPAVPPHLETYDETGLRRLEVRPGLTGLAQVNGNIHLTWPERWVYDARYVDEHSFLLDLKIVLRTFAVIFLGEEKFLNRDQTLESPPASKASQSKDAA